MTLSRAVLAVFFIAAGLGHFISPQPFVAIVPPFLPWPGALVWISGAAEIAGGVGLLFEVTRRGAALGLIALLIAVFPANIYGAIHGMKIAGADLPACLLVARLPFQVVLIWWVHVAGWKERNHPR
ncbi:MAG: DoxX family membrane protein [Verrucomicrobiota bacterium]|nr:DoxX family membrane protein [Verrucomicrobiota bacterium]